MRRWAIPASALLTLFCRPSDPVPLPLFGDFQSYSSVAQTTAGLTKLSLTWREVKRSAGDSRYPAYDWVTIDAGPVDFASCRGTLELQFFNDRLMQTLFFPGSDCNLAHAETVAKEKTRASLTMGTALGGRRYLAWADPVLAKENQAWLDRWS